jgi:hypothetical protein
MNPSCFRVPDCNLSLLNLTKLFISSLLGLHLLILRSGKYCQTKPGVSYSCIFILSNAIILSLCLSSLHVNNCLIFCPAVYLVTTYLVSSTSATLSRADMEPLLGFVANLSREF